MPVRILIFGLPGSGKSTLAKPFAQEIGAIHLEADKIREEYNDWDFSYEGRVRQALRMRHLSDGIIKAGKIAVADFICPTVQAREQFDAHYTIWMDTIKEGRYADTNIMFEPPKEVNYHVSKWFNDTPVQLADVLKRFKAKNV